jgi:iron complex transport system ATP-binding protein
LTRPRPAGDAPALAVDDAWFAYDPRREPVVRGVSVRVARGEFLGVLGPNGAGKSTLLRLMAGLARPSRGTVTAAGRALSELPRSDAARAIAFVPQREPAVFGFTARELVAMGRAPHTGWFGTLSAADHQAVDAALARCEVAALGGRRMSELSGGEQKRVLIARALAQRAPLVLLDEPIAFLDIHHQLAVCDLLAAGVARGEFTAVAVLHDLNLAAQYCDRLLVLRGGATLALGTVAEVMTYAQIKAAFEAEVYVGQNEINRTRFFVPMRSPREAPES